MSSRYRFTLFWQYYRSSLSTTCLYACAQEGENNFCAFEAPWGEEGASDPLGKTKLLIQVTQHNQVTRFNVVCTQDRVGLFEEITEKLETVISVRCVQV